MTGDRLQTLQTATTFKPASRPAGPIRPEDIRDQGRQHGLTRQTGPSLTWCLTPPYSQGEISVLAAVLVAINRFNAAHPWSHNDFYQRWLLRQLPDRLPRTIDVGCGTGNLVLAISQRADIAEGIDVDAGVIATACARAQARPNAVFAVRDLLDLPGEGHYDAVTAVAVVHHLPLTEALAKMRGLAAPGGRIVIIGCYRAATMTDHLVGLAAVPMNMIMGLLKSARAVDARVAMSAPTANPQHTLTEIRHASARILPGARIRRRLFWRYSLTYSAPTR